MSNGFLFSFMKSLCGSCLCFSVVFNVFVSKSVCVCVCRCKDVGVCKDVCGCVCVCHEGQNVPNTGTSSCLTWSVHMTLHCHFFSPPKCCPFPGKYSVQQFRRLLFSLCARITASHTLQLLKMSHRNRNFLFFQYMMANGVPEQTNGCFCI